MEQERFAVVDPYGSIPELYDLEHATYDDDLGLYRSLAKGTGEPILELGCGTGRILVPLAQAGHQVTGVDSSAPMLARAAEAVAAADVADRVGLRRGSMVDVEQVAPGPFGLVVIALNGLMHMATAAGQRQTLAGVRRVLGASGQMVVDLLNPHPELLQTMEGVVEHEGSWLRADGSRVDKFASRRVVPAEQQIETDLWYDVTDQDGSLRRVATSYPMRYLHRAELDLVLELAGFTTWSIYGSYELDRYDDESDRLLAIAEG